MSTKLTFTANDFLNDTTITNPYLTDYGVKNRPWRLYLTVKDNNNNNISTDSINIQISSFIYKLAEYDFNLPLGDSIQFYDDVFVDGGIPPLKYYWTPSYGLSDSARINSWCKPLKSTDYYQYIVDAAGCKCNPNRAYQITVIPTSVKNNPEELGNALSLRQHGERLIFNNPNSKSANLIFYSMEGKKLYSSETNNSFFDMHYLLNNSSIKICVLYLNGSIATLKVY